MIIYLLIFLFSLLLVTIKDRKIKIIGSNSLLLLMSLMCMLRGKDVGSDTTNYVTIYDSVVGLTLFLRKDPLFAIIGLLTHYIGNYKIFQVILGIITYLPIFIVFNKYSKNIAISLLIFIFATNRYFFETFNIARQAAAASYLLWCWIMIDKRQYKNALLLYLIAIGFHHTSLIYLPLVFIAWKFKISYRTIWIFTTIMLIFSLFFSNMDLLVSLQKSILSAETIGKYDNYEKELARSIWGLLPVVLPYAFICLYGYKKNKDNFLFRLYAYGSLFAIFISVLPMAYRISYGTSILELLVIPLLTTQKTNNKILLYCVIICIVGFSFIDFITTCKLAKLVPYNTF